MLMFRICITLAWLSVITVSVHAVETMGLAPGGIVFFQDFAHPWRAQYNADFSMHLLLMAAWIAYRENRLLGIPLGLFAIMFGGAYSLAYIFIATFKAEGRFDRLLLGRRT
ncbi:DUF1475 family protein [Solimonas terrae]|uniref:DUF2834 domain-containing protein n=1 Tax=Solimonas terrae TaxID=1396819 RepID=A0A6M2BZ43_9GAMM|nr:DUF1475 family protein [Solimonas terrae]NGY07059.1 hypothetical protein [Solimonas terrae]